MKAWVSSCASSGEKEGGSRGEPAGVPHLSGLAALQLFGGWDGTGLAPPLVTSAWSVGVSQLDFQD